MPLPELQTQGIDLTNTLMRIKQLEANDLQQAHLKKQNALLDLQSSPEAIRLLRLKAETEANTKRLEQQKAQIENEKAILGAVQGHISAIQPDLDDYRKAKQWLLGNKNLQVRPGLLPDEEAFLQPDLSSATGKRFDKKAFEGWQKMVTRSAKDLQTDPTKNMQFGTVHLPDGRAIKVPLIPGAIYDPEQEGFPAGSSMEAPKEKKEGVETWGPEEILPSGERKQTSSRGKTKYEAPLKKEKEDQTLVPVQQPDGSSIYMKRSLAEGKKVPGKKNDRESVRSIVTNEKGETVIILKDGKPKVYGFDADGSVSLVDPKPEQLKGVVGLGKAESPAEKAMREMLEGGKKEEQKTSPQQKYLHTATNAKGEKVGWNGTEWVPIDSTR